MVNNAGVSYPAPIVDADPAHWRAMFETNVIALLEGVPGGGARHARLRRRGARRQHLLDRRPARYISGVYGATKHAVNCISATLRRELEEDSIRVVNIMPGAIVTSFAHAHFDPAVVAGFVQMAGAAAEVPPGGRLPDEVIAALQPKMRQLFASADDVAAAVLYAVTQPIQVNIAEMVVRPAKRSICRRGGRGDHGCRDPRRARIEAARVSPLSAERSRYRAADSICSSGKGWPRRRRSAR
ncbi:MAG: SDR family NAD(P)-dependent oxidoreductase [Candidatus Binatia bacterium]